MDLIKDKSGDISIIRPKGKLDTITSGKFKDEIMEMINSGAQKLAFDFRNVVYISSTGLSALLKFAKALKRSGGRLVLYSMDDNVRNVFDVVGFQSIADIYQTEEEALNSFNPS